MEEMKEMKEMNDKQHKQTNKRITFNRIEKQT